MPGFLDDTAVAERVLQHIAAGTTDRGAEVWREPVEHYRSPERLAREIRDVLRRFTTPFCPSAALPEAGSYVAREAAGVPVLVVRGRDGRVRAFRNACRHRGTPLVEGAGCAQALVCPYHGWAYRLDGRLQAVPHADGFPELDLDAHGLAPLLAREHHGLVFVGPDAEAPEVDGTAELPEQLAPGQRLLGSSDSVVEANWKVYLEGFIEGYHIRFAHKDTFYPYGFDNLNLVEACGAHSRVTYPFRRIEKLASVPAAERSVDGRLTYVTHLLPNAVLTVLSHHTNLLVLEPIDVDRTRVFSWFLTNRPAEDETGEQAAERANRDSGFVNQTGAVEDLALVTSIQRSIDSGANDVFTFGLYESAIAHFHRRLDAALA
jgi:phenylpropionate dioxygenase-like ring-hydroxylating dioxygenase large terminal subunit